MSAPRPLIYLHGFGNTDPERCRVARAIRAALPGAELHCPCYHPRGDYRLTRISRTLAELEAYIRQSPAGQAVVVGYSVGGYIAALLAARSPGLVAALILLAPAIDNFARNFGGVPQHKWYMPAEYVRELQGLPARPTIKTGVVRTVIVHGAKDDDDGGSDPKRVREYAAAIGAALHEPDATRHDLEPWLTSGRKGVPPFEALLAAMAAGPAGDKGRPAKKLHTPVHTPVKKRGRSDSRGSTASPPPAKSPALRPTAASAAASPATSPVTGGPAASLAKRRGSPAKSPRGTPTSPKSPKSPRGTPTSPKSPAAAAAAGRRRQR